MLSVEVAQERLIWLDETAVAVRLVVGGEGGVVSDDVVLDAVVVVVA